MRDSGTVVRLLLRRHQVALGAWVTGLLALAAMTVPAYATTYGSGNSRAALVATLEANAALRMMYGRLQGSSLGELFVWETGSYLVVLACLMALLLGVSMTRGEEDAGRVELLRSTGIRPGTPLVAAVIVLSSACLVVGMGAGAILIGQSFVYDELTVRGGFLFGAVVTLAALATGVVAVLAAQLRGDARSARSLAFGVLAAFFLLRVVADSTGWSWLSWLTPLGWRDLVRPYTDDVSWVVGVLTITVIAAGWIVLRIARKREVGSALWEREAGGHKRLHLAGTSSAGLPGVWSWAWLASRATVLGWTVAVLGLAALFGAMAGPFVSLVEDDAATRALMEQMSRDAPQSVPAMFFGFIASFLALLVMIAAVVLTLRWRAEESSGHVVHELCTGVRRWSSLAARVLVATACGVFLILGAGAVLGVVGRSQLENHETSHLSDAGGPALEWAVAAMMGHVPGLIAAVAIAALITAAAPRLTGLVWVVVVFSGVALYLGELLSMPEWLMDLGLLGHAPDLPATGWPHWDAWVWGWPLGLAVFGTLGIIAALVLIPRRDLHLR